MLAFIGSISHTYINFQATDEILTEGVYKHLETTVQSRAQHIETFLNKEKELAENLALTGKAEKALLEPSETNILALNKRLQKTVGSIEHILSVGVINDKNILIASTNSELIGTDYSESIFLKENLEKKEKIQFNDDPDLGIILGIVSPVEDGVGKYLGMVGIIIGFSEINKITTDKTGLGETGESYLINKESMLLTPSRFMENSILVQEVDTINAQNCLEHLEHKGHEHDIQEHYEHEAITPFLDYRGELVLGTHHYIPETEWCLLVEIDEAEVLGIVKAKLLQKFVISVVIILILVFLISFFVGEYLEKIYLKKGGRNSIKRK